MTLYLLLAAALVAIVSLTVATVRNLRARRAVKAARDAEMDAFMKRDHARRSEHVYAAVSLYVDSRKIGELMSSSLTTNGECTTITGKIIVPLSSASVDVFDALMASEAMPKLSMVMGGKLRHVVGKFSTVTVKSRVKTGEVVAKFKFIGGPLTSDGEAPPSMIARRTPQTFESARAVANTSN